MSVWRGYMGKGWPEVEDWEKRVARLLWNAFWVACSIGFVALICLGLPGCASTTDVEVLSKPVTVNCRIDDVDAPTWALDTVQLTGDPKRDLVLIERAMEAEIEQRIAYERQLEAALEACR